MTAYSYEVGYLSTKPAHVRCSGRPLGSSLPGEPTSHGSLVAMNDCFACQLTDGRRPLPAGLIHAAAGWRVEHSVGPLGLGTLIVKPERHITAVADLDDGDASALGPVLRRASAVASALVPAEQVYNCLWSHAGGIPVHIHYVVQPVTATQMKRFGSYGPNLQTAMFSAGELPDPEEVEAVARQARQLFASS